MIAQPTARMNGQVDNPIFPAPLWAMGSSTHFGPDHDRDKKRQTGDDEDALGHPGWVVLGHSEQFIAARFSREPVSDFTNRALLRAV